MDNENIVRLAELQERSALLPPTAEEALALGFAHEHEHDLRYVAAWGQWLSFDGTCWMRDTTLHAFDQVRAHCREEALASDKPATIASAKTVAAVAKLARADRRLAATSDQWDSCPLALQTTAGTIDLRTGIGRAPDPADYITKRTACAIAPPGTPHPLWSAFLARVTGDDGELQAFLQRYLGYCCTGLTTEHAFVFAYGTGANGKSTLTGVITRILGDYAGVADMGTFIASTAERHPTDLAKLHGARLVVAQETQRGRRWDETKIKALTGGDRLTARFMRQDFFEFTPAFKLLIAGNHKPRLSGVDEAMRRRLLLVPFTVRIPPAQRDPNLADKLWNEREAILRWCVDGALLWQRDGLAPPAAVREATDEYFRDEDTVGQWMEDCTEDGGQHALTRTATLFASWKAWCEERNFRPGSMHALAHALTDQGFEKARDKDGQRGFRRIAVKRK
jgi:putative DNA primase/helicase